MLFSNYAGYFIDIGFEANFSYYIGLAVYFQYILLLLGILIHLLYHINLSNYLVNSHLQVDLICVLYVYTVRDISLYILFVYSTVIMYIFSLIPFIQVFFVIC